MSAIQRTFQDLGENRVNAVYCRSMDEALKALAKYRPTTLLLDDCLEKPGDGLEIARQLKNQTSRRCEIISITGSVDPQIIKGYADLKIKVIGKTGLVGTIKSLLAK